MTSAQLAILLYPALIVGKSYRFNRAGGERQCSENWMVGMWQSEPRCIPCA
ncbi:hypothetical protein O7632_00115 [Solwaraspora sp. WMMD406]|uniref:hypothetical protein n=1 Tax=Solwaraspora sp. WMMD406 TaxID=3016095 RepID=UPI0024161C92|nr:hypothetical protein [Solwaraspora sp. WMMD406]MDG4762528.1 hypothetical protein [Solwaraspora sp. WMMD406]